MSENWKIQISPKTPSGTLINVRGETAEEVQALLAGVHELVVLVVGIEQAFAGVHNVAPLSTGLSTVTPPVQVSSSAGFPSTPPVTAPPSSGPTCLHGARTYVFSKPGSAKKWAMWACPLPKDAIGKCEPIWA